MRPATLGAAVKAAISLGACAVAALVPMSAAAQTPQLPPPDTLTARGGNITIQPVNHASFVMTYRGLVIYVDPVGGVERYLNLPLPDLIVVTDIHGDHMNAGTINALVSPHTRIIAPAAVNAQLTPNLQARTTVVQNRQTTTWEGITFEAVPMYNVTEGRTHLHTPGRGNGYIITFGNRRIYVAGDTEPTREMAALRNIDVAFVPMNQPFTMTPQQAADAVRSFRPRIVYPYHSRNSDLDEFTRLVGDASEVRLRAWY